MNGWLCDTCLSDDIYQLSDASSEMDIYCGQCKSPNYKVSKWFIEYFEPPIHWYIRCNPNEGADEGIH